MSVITSLRERVGNVIGQAWSPAIAAIARARRARMFHPDGIVCRGRVEPIGVGDLAALGERLTGPVMARFSAALWRGRLERLDVLGVALRFGDDQDLLLATIRSPFTMPLAPLTTDTHDYFANDFWAVAPFDVAGVGRAKLRLVAEIRSPSDGARDARLIAAVERGDARWRLELRRVFRRGWDPVARISLDEIADLDQAALRFDPFRAGRGIAPRGLVHAIRPSAYAASQRARPSHEA